MDITNDEKLGIAPTVATIEFFAPDGKRYNFEQMVLDTASSLELTHESGNRVIIKFWQTRQSERNFPVDPESGKHYEQEIMPTTKVPHGIVSR
jgi:hypothetical protein